MKKRIIFYVVIAQLIIIATIITGIVNKKQAVLGESIKLNKIDKDSVTTQKIDSLNHYYELKPGIQHQYLDWKNTGGPEIPTYKINKDTLNQIKDIDTKKPDDVFRIVTIGDSFTFGVNINTEDNYPSQLQDFLNKNCTNKFEVLNLGVGGYDIKYTVERYKLRGQKYDPDLVLWLFIDDDFRRINEYLIPLNKKMAEESKRAGTYDEYLKNGDYYHDWKVAQDEIIEKLGGMEEVLKLQRNYFNEFKKYFDKDLLLLNFPYSLPEYKSFLNSVASDQKSGHYYDGISNLFENPGTLLPDGHPSAEGYYLISQDIFAYLTSNGLISCKK